MEKFGKIFLILIVTMLLGIKNINAQEFYFTNNNGVNFTEREYNYVTQLFFDGYQNDMTQSEFNSVMENIDGEVHKYVLGADHRIENTRGTHYLDTTDRELIVTTSCGNTTCTIVEELNWDTFPATRSYDLLGAYSSKAITNSSIVTKLYKNGNLNNTYTSAQTFSNGFGQSVKLPTGTLGSLDITQSFTVKKGGSLHVTYQHATQSITLTKSKSYTISPSGMGGVFNHNYSSYYDFEDGIYITL